MTEVIDEAARERNALYDAANYPGVPDNSFDQLFTLGNLTAKLLRGNVDVAAVSDRSPLNLESLADHSEHFSGTLRLRGVVLSGGELDQDVERIMADESTLRQVYDKEPEQVDRILGFAEEAEPIDRGDFILQRKNPLTDKWDEFFRVAHEPYDPAMLRSPDGEGDQYRESLGGRIVNHLDRIGSDLIFLDNYKVILPANVVRMFAGKMLNVHPSVLPLIKGYRPEKRAYEGENPEANGYTVHVVSEDLDGGPTLLQQKVPILPFGQELFDQMGEEAYSHYREEQARLRIMTAQAPVIPWALHLYASALDRKVVEDSEAFAAEGRPDFVVSQAYKEARAQEPDSSPYRRVLFENPLANSKRNDQPEYVTLEQLLSIPPTADVSRHINGIHHYRFNIPVLTGSSNQAGYTDIEYLVENLRQSGIPTHMQTGNITFDGAEVALRSLTDCSNLLGRMRVPYRYRQQRVHVQTPRVPVSSRYIQFAGKS